MASKTTSVMTGGTNSATTTAEEVNALATDFIAAGVVGAITLNTGSGGTGSFAVNAQGTPAMSVRVSAGQLYCAGTPTGGNSQTVRTKMTAFEDVTIAANATGGTRYDWVYLVLDAAKLAAPGVNKDDIATLTTSRSTSSASDNGTPPTYGYCLAVVTVANGASSITNSNITDSRTQTGASFVATGAGVGSPQVATGVCVQQVSTLTTAASTGTTVIPLDDTIPQNTEGDQCMTVTITPKSATNILVIEAVGVAANTAAAYYILLALFQDSTGNALAATAAYGAAASSILSVPLTHTMVAGTTSATTFKIRVGSNVAGTTTFNGAIGNRYLGAITKSTLIVREYKA